MYDARTTVGFLVRFKLLPGKLESGHAFLRESADAVQAAEPETLVYAFFQGPKDPLEVIVFEIFTSNETKHGHEDSPLMTEVRTKLPQFADMKTFVVDSLDAGLAGFVR